MQGIAYSYDLGLTDYSFWALLDGLMLFVPLVLGVIFFILYRMRIKARIFLVGCCFSFIILFLSMLYYLQTWNEYNDNKAKLLNGDVSVKCGRLFGVDTRLSQLGIFYISGYKFATSQYDSQSYFNQNIQNNTAFVNGQFVRAKHVGYKILELQISEPNQRFDCSEKW